MYTVQRVRSRTGKLSCHADGAKSQRGRFSSIHPMVYPCFPKSTAVPPLNKSRHIVPWSKTPLAATFEATENCSPNMFLNRIAFVKDVQLSNITIPNLSVKYSACKCLRPPQIVVHTFSTNNKLQPPICHMHWAGLYFAESVTKAPVATYSFAARGSLPHVLRASLRRRNGVGAYRQVWLRCNLLVHVFLGAFLALC